jgi:hypothetical protein
MYNQAKQGAFEAGFDATYEYINVNPYSSTWMREDAALLTVFVSDEQEQSQTHFNNVQEFSNWYANVRDYTYVASIVNLPQNQTVCTGNHNPNNVGTEYIDAANRFNGAIVDICSTDWSSGVMDASNQVNPYEYYELTNTPLDTNYIYVFFNGQPNYDWTYSSQYNRIDFTVIPPEQTLVEIAYYIH